MKGILIILSLFLSCLFSGSGVSRDAAWERPCEAAVLESAEQDTKDRDADFKDPAILPERAATYSGDGNSYAPSARSNSGGRRVHDSSRSTSRIIKAGKVFDQNNFHAFRALILQFQSGVRSNSRYIHTICHLLI